MLFRGVRVDSVTGDSASDVTALVEALEEIKRTLLETKVRGGEATRAGKELMAPQEASIRDGSHPSLAVASQTEALKAIEEVRARWFWESGELFTWMVQRLKDACHWIHRACSARRNGLPGGHQPSLQPPQQLCTEACHSLIVGADPAFNNGDIFPAFCDKILKTTRAAFKHFGGKVRILRWMQPNQNPGWPGAAHDREAPHIQVCKTRPRYTSLRSSL